MQVAKVLLTLTGKTISGVGADYGLNQVTIRFTDGTAITIQGKPDLNITEANHA